MYRLTPRIPPLRSRTRAKVSLAALFFLAAACAMHPERRQTVLDRDFLEEPPAAAREGISEEISALKAEIERDFANAELHRRLAVLYRLQGTPRSRLLSSDEIERAIMLDPGNAIYRVEKGLTFAARRFVGEAEAAFHEATKLDPRCSEAWFQLGVLQRDEYVRTMCFPDHIEKAIEYFKKALQRRRKHEETLLNLAFLHSLREMNRTGLQYAAKAALYHPTSARAKLLSGMLLTKLERFAEADTFFAGALRLLSEEERSPYENIAPLLSAEERELYLSSFPAKRADWRRRFWSERDPTPSTEINERLLEHYRRVVLAEWSLTNDRLALAGAETDRGATLIRFGPPERRYYDLGSGTSGAWLVWSYPHPDGAMRLYFHDEFLSGDYHFPIRDYYGAVSRRLLETAPERYEYPVKYAPFAMGVETAESRGADERTRVEFALAIPDSLSTAAPGPWNLFTTFFDAEWTRFARDRRSFRPDSLPLVEKAGGGYRVYNGAIELLPRELGAACVFELVNNEYLRKSSRRLTIELRSMYGRSLKLSSVKFTLAEQGACGERLDPVPLYRRADPLCLSYEVYNLKLDASGASWYRVTYAIRRPDPDAEGESPSMQRTLAYMWQSIRGEKKDEQPYVKSSFEQVGDSAVVADRLRIDLGSLEAGTYLLVLFVEDLATGQSAAESRTFTISE